MTERLYGRKGQQLRKAVLDTYGTTCHLCGADCSEDFTVDHVVPINLGGSNELGNLRPAHGRKTATCQGNYARGDRGLPPSRNTSRQW